MNTPVTSNTLAANFGITLEVCSQGSASVTLEPASILLSRTRSTEADRMISYAKTSGMINMKLVAADDQHDLRFIDATNVYYHNAIEIAITPITQWQQGCYPGLNYNFMILPPYKFSPQT
ncbi:hypothetical protein QUB80_23205 [Chlorogloeopsis sp. ULAP01]|jgi:hypothetical protein|uniref:hypothetical protein n=1 Tax=Chlorogloeopsis sp. ULAP01 TaxID=3056483 RepID=UPI0025AACAA5|nr:hypothetical protein [Chlorogloeopsis sp. ULAP01]MDM9383599.1 hypothetical protein [Chlorogloeopsis sp. ULAP01]